MSRGTTKIQPVGPLTPLTPGTRWIADRLAILLHSSGLATLLRSFRRFSPCRLSVGSAETLALHRLNNIKFSFRMIVFYYKGINRMWQEIFFAKGRLGPNSHKIGTKDLKQLRLWPLGRFGRRCYNECKGFPNLRPTGCRAGQRFIGGNRHGVAGTAGKPKK